MWLQYKRAQAGGPQAARPEPLSVMAKGSASCGSCEDRGAEAQSHHRAARYTVAGSKPMTPRQDAAQSS